MTEARQYLAGEHRPVTRLIRLAEVKHRVGLSRSTIYRWMAEGRFPRPARLGNYIVAWEEQVIDDWIGRHGSLDGSEE